MIVIRVIFAKVRLTLWCRYTLKKHQHTRLLNIPGSPRSVDCVQTVWRWILVSGGGAGGIHQRHTGHTTHVDRDGSQIVASPAKCFRVYLIVIMIIPAVRNEAPEY